VQDVLTDGHVVLTLLALRVGQDGRAFKVPVRRPDKRSWQVGDGGPRSLLASADEVMRLAGRHAVDAEDPDDPDD
jgi:hypothetical protein